MEENTSVMKTSHFEKMTFKWHLKGKRRNWPGKNQTESITTHAGALRQEMDYMFEDWRKTKAHGLQRAEVVVGKVMRWESEEEAGRTI